MRSRPWPVVILALLQLVIPFASLYLASTFYSMDFGRYIKTLSYLKGPIEFWSFFILPFVAAGAIFAVRRWSYPVFLTTIVWSLVVDLSHWTMSSTVFPTAVLIGTYAFNIAVVSYLMIPTVWSLYSNPKAAWWRSKERYLLNHTGNVKGGHGVTECRVLDISKGGAFLESTWELGTTEDITVSFNYSGLLFSAKAKIVHGSKRNVLAFGYGIQFKEMDRSNSKALSQILNSLKQLNMEAISRAERGNDSLWSWMANVLSTGNGLVPTVPTQVLQPISKNTAKKLQATKKAA